MLLPEVRDVDPDALLDLYDGAERYVRGGMVTSADGSTAWQGSSRPLSGPADMAVFRTLRAVADVVLVGAGTAAGEDYGRIPLRASAREWRAQHGRAPEVRLAVVSRRLDLPPKVLDARPVVVTCASSAADRRAALRGVADVVVAGDAEVDLPAAVDALAGLGLSRVLCEGGPQLLQAVTAAGLLDELCLTLSPLLAGGAPGLLVQPLVSLLPMRLLHLLEDDGALLARYGVAQPP
jgi:riboflavin biosynthesis pyrimidine reductase